jgi:hypothetical protein
MSLIVPGCVLLFALLARIVLDTTDTGIFTDLRLRHSLDLVPLPGGTFQADIRLDRTGTNRYAMQWDPCSDGPLST